MGLARGWLVLSLAAMWLGCDNGSAGPDAVDAVDEGGADADDADAADTDADAGEEDVEVEADAPPFVPDPDRMLADIEFLAGPECTGRAVGTPGNELALEFVETRFEALGMEPAGDDGTYRHHFDVNLWTLLEAPRLSVGTTELRHRDDFFPFGYSPSAVAVTGPLVFIGHGFVVPPFDATEYPECLLDPGGYDDYGGLDVDGAILLVHWGEPAVDAWENCPVQPFIPTAVERGAVSWLLVQDDAQYKLGVSLNAQDVSPGFPIVTAKHSVVVGLVPDLPTWLEDIRVTSRPSAHDTGLTATMDFETSTVPIVADNVLGAFPGTDPAHAGEVIVVGAHVDHLGTDEFDGTMYPGADDNASGTAMMMELARGVAEGVGEPSRTIVFAAWNAEERPFIGACSYVARPTYPLASTVAALNMDSVGVGAGLALANGAAAANQWLTRLMGRRRVEAGLSATLTTDNLREGDDVCFLDAGVPVLAGCALGARPYLHTPEDTAEHIVVDGLGINAQLMWLVLESLARATEGEYAK